MKLIRYNLSGRIVEQCSIEFKQLKTSPMGEKVRITMNDGNVYVGFWDAPFENHSAKTAELVRYDLDENNSKLRSFNNVSIFIPIQNIVKIEAILHSNPRWGTRPTNKFVFAELVKINLESSAPFRNWPIK